MRANMPQELVLSIGMIVKNEAKTLEKCLLSLQKLREEIPSELIIADTGSEDGTLAIARKYADQVFRFNWCDDFAAARNATLDRSSGEWFFLIDADEWFENTDELIRFFKSAKRKEAHTLTYVQRNYEDAAGTIYSEFFAARAYRRLPDRRFAGAVHESMPIISPIFSAHDYVHHYGYIEGKKGTRNIPLMLKRIEAEDGKIVHSFAQLAHEYISANQPKEAQSTALKGLDLMREQKLATTSIYALFYELIHSSLILKQYDRVIRDVEQYFEERPRECTTDIDLSYFMQTACMVQKDYKKAMEYFERYERLCALLEERKLSEEERLSVIISYYRPSNRLSAAKSQCLCLYYLERAAEALDYIDVLFERMPAARSDNALHSLEATCIKKLECYERYPTRYRKVYASKEERPMALLEQEIDLTMFSDQKAHTIIADLFIEHTGCEGDYADLLRLRRYRGLDNPEKLQDMLEHAPATVLYGELPYFAMCAGMDFLPFIERVDMDALGDYISRMARGGDLGAQVQAYYKTAPNPERLVALRWETVLLETVLLQTVPSVVGAMPLFERYCLGVATYVHTVYNPDLLEDEDRIVIPRACRFGLMAEEAYILRNSKNQTGFLRKMQEAGELYPVMLKFVKQLAEDVKIQIETDVRLREEERQLLLENIRKAIYQLIDSGDLENARRAVEEYAKASPKEEDIPALRSLCQTAGHIS